MIGFGHFAGVVGLCLSEHHKVRHFDFEPRLVREGQPAASCEPGWMELAAKVGRYDPIHIHHPPSLELQDCDLLWIAYDVPLDSAGAPVIDEILMRIQRLDAALPKSIPFLVSCQWPVGTTRKIAQQCEGREFVYVMENVRVGKAIADFKTQPFPFIGAPSVSRVICDFISDCGVVNPPLMSWESAELAKHTTNAFMALQIAFINEIGRIAEVVGADKADVSRALMSDARVSPNAPLKPGGPFGGGSLKRDLLVLEHLAQDHALSLSIISAILPSNSDDTFPVPVIP